MAEVLAELRRYVPQQDPRHTLLADLSWLLRLERRVRSVYMRLPCTGRNAKHSVIMRLLLSSHPSLALVFPT